MSYHKNYDENHDDKKFGYTSPSRDIERLGGEGILNAGDVADLSAGVRRVFDLLQDKSWHTALEVCAAAQGSEGTRRLRELRAWLEQTNQGTICREARSGRTWIYRLVLV